MLKKNLVRMGFFGPGLFLLMPITGLKSPDNNSKETYVAGFHSGNLVDTAISDRMDSAILMASTSTDLAKAPANVPAIQLNKHVVNFVKSYLVKEDEVLTLVKKRSKSYFPLFDTIFTHYNLPLELKYLAVVESDLQTNALSRVGAKGMWQLMPGTARELGLKITNKYDERTHAYRSTVAAAKYLKDLYAEFGDWLLVIAAYNGGPGTVYKAIKRSGSRNFWALQNFLPEESRGHVKRFISTHYYFEGKGSFTTMTKAETIAYVKVLETLKESKDAEVADSTNTVVSR
ncbi:MAG: lytic transglycosylase domain-containing protein [Flavisolibacter sp.]